MIVKAYGKEFICDRAVKGENFINLYQDETCIQQFIGISDFSNYEFVEGEPDTATAEIEELKKRLEETDYVIIKIAEGVSTAEDYAEIIAQRQEWRERINELESELD